MPIQGSWSRQRLYRKPATIWPDPLQQSRPLSLLAGRFWCYSKSSACCYCAYEKTRNTEAGELLVCVSKWALVAFCTQRCGV